MRTESQPAAKPAKTPLTAERLRAVLTYDPNLGVFTAKPGRCGIRAGSNAGSLDADGYRRMMIDGVIYPASHLAWFWMKGEWPAEEVDHKNLKRDDDRFENLRPCTRAQNNANRALRKDKKLRIKGVSLRHRPKDRPYQAHITVEKRFVSLGYFATAEEAGAAYALAAVARFGEFARAA